MYHWAVLHLIELDLIHDLIYQTVSRTDELMAKWLQNKTEDLRRTYWSWIEFSGFCQKIVSFYKMNKCHYLLVPVLVIQLYSNDLLHNKKVVRLMAELMKLY